MFKHLLIPLDGSTLAEAALPAAVRLATMLNAQVTLVHIIERDAPDEIHGERHLTNPDEALQYLEATARVFPREINVDIHVHTTEVTNVARSIAEHIRELGPDLIVMCTHGRGGLRRWMFGRIAQQVVGFDNTPVLMVQPKEDGTASPFVCRLFVVALDGNPEHEEGLPVAASLAKICKAELHLIMVVPTFATLTGTEAATAKMLPGATYAMLNLAEHDAEEYLHRQVTQLQAAGLKASASVHRGNAPAIIVAVAEKTGADLLVMATHGKTGLDAFWSGSTTPSVTSRSDIPLLLVPVPEKEPAGESNT